MFQDKGLTAYGMRAGVVVSVGFWKAKRGQQACNFPRANFTRRSHGLVVVTKDAEAAGVASFHCTASIWQQGLESTSYVSCIQSPYGMPTGHVSTTVSETETTGQMHTGCLALGLCLGASYSYFNAFG